MKAIARGIYGIDGLKMGRAYIVEDHDGLTLIDTSSPSALNGILGAITALGRRVDDLRTIVATHYHFDHTGNVAALRERSGAAFCAHEADVPYIDGRTPWGKGGEPGALTRMMSPEPYALTVDRVLRDGDTIDAAGGLTVVHAPGHTPGNIALYARGRSVLFGGDAFMNLLGLQLPPGASTHDMDEAKRTVRKLAALPFDLALPGHGGPIISRASEKLGEWSRRWFAD